MLINRKAYQHAPELAIHAVTALCLYIDSCFVMLTTVMLTSCVTRDHLLQQASYDEPLPHLSGGATAAGAGAGADHSLNGTAVSPSQLW